MAGHRRLKDGVLSPAYVPAGTRLVLGPGMTKKSHAHRSL
jgi:hypothetical protein